MLVDKGQDYDRAGKRRERNALNNQPEPADGVYDGADDDIARATYPDAKARHIALNDPDNTTIDDKRALANTVEHSVDGVVVAELVDTPSPAKHRGKRKG